MATGTGGGGPTDPLNDLVALQPGKGGSKQPSMSQAAGMNNEAKRQQRANIESASKTSSNTIIDKDDEAAAKRPGEIDVSTAQMEIQEAGEMNGNDKPDDDNLMNFLSAPQSPASEPSPRIGRMFRRSNQSKGKDREKNKDTSVSRNHQPSGESPAQKEEEEEEEGGNKESGQTRFMSRLRSEKKETQKASAAVQKQQERREENRESKAKGGKRLLKQLKEQSGVETEENWVGAKNLTGKTNQGEGKEGEESQRMEKDFNYKLRAFTRRAEERARQSMASHVNSSEEGSESSSNVDSLQTLWDSVKSQESKLQQLDKHTNQYVKAMESMLTTFSKMATDVAELVEPNKEVKKVFENANENPEDAFPSDGKGPQTKAEASNDRAAQLKAVAEALRGEILSETRYVFQNGVQGVIKEQLEEFPSYQQCMDKRKKYLLDCKAYERHAARDAEHKEEAEKAERRFTSFSMLLEEELGAMRTQRHENALSLLDGIIDAQAFFLAKSRDTLHTLEDER